MSFSLYGALPPSKSDKAGADGTKNEASANQSSGLYSSLSAPESGSTKFKSNPQESSLKPTSLATTTTTTTTTASTADVQPTKPAGWSAINTFRPVLRRPTIQAKPKLNKPFIPAGATIVSTKTITKEDREKELQMESEAKKASLEEQQKKNDNIDLGVIPLLTTADDVNGFRATQKASKKKKKGGKAAAANAPPQPVVFNMLEDYDPHRPNDYEQYKEERRELKEQQKRKREWEKKQDVERSWSRSRSPSRSRSSSRSNSPSKSRSSSPHAHVAVDPSPSSKINVNETAEDAYRRRLRMSQQQQQPNIMPEPPRMEELGPAPHVAAPIIKEIPSQVILLTNMVGPGEVDDMLQEETAEECSKYGKVERCLIFEVPKGRISDDRAVRIFVQFSSMDSARNAIQDLHGRFFGGRIVSATYFDMKRFERLDLAPSKEEFC
ncbi:uncharacterized protein ATC70_009492 [Mucor velutinosus]|uniref:RRM domain-containing protein n=1 Tax=Mucor velutinosus TaxID=708070 RepID=A0AAN7HV32_9FUNG|nr:hypothetical protein ATC70_009492 [Mucor velutinosus]